MYIYIYTQRGGGGPWSVGQYKGGIVTEQHELIMLSSGIKWIKNGSSEGLGGLVWTRLIA